MAKQTEKVMKTGDEVWKQEAALMEQERRPGGVCFHCGRPPRGHALFGARRLCHPDGGMDCYRLVTVYRHPMPCIACAMQVAYDHHRYLAERMSPAERAEYQAGKNRRMFLMRHVMDLIEHMEGDYAA